MDSNADDDNQFRQWAATGISRLEWAYHQLENAEETRRWSTTEFDESVGVVRDENGLNVYHFMVTRNLKSATRSFQAAVHLLKEPYGSIPVEILLRAGLIASAKAQFLLHPAEQESRESRLRQLYNADRSSLDHAVARELKLVGLEAPNDASAQRRPQAIQESKILRDVLDALIERENCRFGGASYGERDLEGLRHRIMRLWWLYSSVAHGNLWHIEKGFQAAPSGSGHTTGNIGLAVHDLSWLYAESVALFVERYELTEHMGPLGLNVEVDKTG